MPVTNTKLNMLYSELSYVINPNYLEDSSTKIRYCKRRRYSLREAILRKKYIGKYIGKYRVKNTG